MLSPAGPSSGTTASTFGAKRPSTAPGPASASTCSTISRSTPSAGAGTSIATLSVSSSTSGSPPRPPPGRRPHRVFVRCGLAQRLVLGDRIADLLQPARDDRLRPLAFYWDDDVDHDG